MAKPRAGKSRRVTSAGKHGGKNAKKTTQAKQAAVAEAKNKGRNWGEPSDEVIKRHWANVEAKKKKADVAAEAARQAKQEWRSALSLAKDDGLDVDDLKKAMKTAAASVNESVQSMRNQARYLRAVDAELANPQYEMFPWLDKKSKTKGEPRLEGEAAGKNAEPKENNPYPFGSDDWSIWNVGHQIGTDSLAESLTKNGPTADAQAAGP